MWGAFDFVEFKVIWGLFGAPTQNSGIRKRLTIERNGLKFGVWDVLVKHMWNTLNVAVFDVIWGSFGTLVALGTCDSEETGCKANRIQIWD